MEEIVTKTCTKCGETKPADLEHFRAQKRSRDGLDGWCRICCRKASAEYRAANPDKIKAAKIADKENHNDRIRATNARYYEENTDKKKTQAAEWRLNNPERSRELDRVWREANRDRCNELSRAWSEANPGKRRETRLRSEHKRRAQKDATHEPYERQDIFERDGWICQLCGQPVDPEIPWRHPMSKTIDHILPLSRGGGDRPDNVQLAHMSCNSRKHNKIEFDDLDEVA